VEFWKSVEGKIFDWREFFNDTINNKCGEYYFYVLIVLLLLVCWKSIFRSFVESSFHFGEEGFTIE
jgi:hypothetical protein